MIHRLLDPRWQPPWWPRLQDWWNTSLLNRPAARVEIAHCQVPVYFAGTEQEVGKASDLRRAQRAQQFLKESL